MWLFCLYWEGLQFDLLCVYDMNGRLSNDNLLVLVDLMSSSRQIEDLKLLTFCPYMVHHMSINLCFKPSPYLFFSFQSILLNLAT